MKDIKTNGMLDNSRLLELRKLLDFEDISVPGYTKLSNNPDVKTAIDKIADTVSNMTIHLMENTPDGDVRIHNELSKKIDINPCRNMTRKTWIYNIVQNMLLNGNAIVFPKMNVFEGKYYIEDLIPLPQSEWFFQYDNVLDYQIEFNGKSLSNNEVVHFAMNPDPDLWFMGTGYRVQLRDVVNNLKQATETKNQFMSGKYMPRVIVKVDSTNDVLTSEEGKNEIERRYLDRGKAGKPWIIPADLLEIEQVKPLSLKDIAIVEGMELDKKTVAGLIGVPAFLLGVGSYNKEEYNNFISSRIMSVATIIAQTLTRDLLRSANLYFKLNPRSLYSYDLKELVESGERLVKINAMRRNELRDWLGLPPDEEMNDLLVLENYLHQDDLDKQKKLKGGDE